MRGDPVRLAKGLGGREGFTRADVETLMHLDGCHFFCWVVRQKDGQVLLSFDERRGDDLAVHGRFTRETWTEKGQRKSDGPCERCKALRGGALRKSETKVLPDFPDDAKESFWAVMAAVGEIEEAA